MRMPTLTSVRGQTLLTDTKPYLFRQSPIESQMLEDMIVGGTVAIRQYVKKPTFETPWGDFHNATVSISNGVITGTASGNGNTYLGLYTDSGVANHVYIASVDVMLASTNTQDYARGILAINWSAGGNVGVDQPAKGSWGKLSVMLKPNASFTVFAFYPFYTATTQAGETVSVKNPYLIDLTQMFGTVIADYMYSLETQTAGSGIAWLKSYGFFTKDFYPYDAGSLLSVKTSGHKTVKGGITHTYPLSDIELRGIPQLVNNELQYDGDSYESDGTVTRRFEIVDLGTLTWAYVTTSERNYFRAIVNNIKQNSPVVCSKYPYGGLKYDSEMASAEDKTIYNPRNSAYMYVKDSSYTTGADFKTAMSGVFMVYELATPTSETTDAFENPQQAGSTEEYVDERTVPMPVGHTTQYFNMVQMEKIQMHMPTHSPIKMHMPKGD